MCSFFQIFVIILLKTFRTGACTWADYKGEPCGSRPPPLASSAWTAVSAKHTSWIEEAAPPKRSGQSHCSYLLRVLQRHPRLREEVKANLLQVEDGSRDPLDTVEHLLRVWRPLEPQSSVSVQVELPPDSGVFRLTAMSKRRYKTQYE